MEEIIIKRKFRYFLEAKKNGTILFNVVAKPPVRPELKVDEEQIDFLGNKPWIPGKKYWEETLISIFGYDKQDINIEGIDALTLTLYDGCANPLEVWEYYELDKVELQNQEADEAGLWWNFDLKFRYNKLKYQNLCQPLPQPTIPTLTCPHCDKKISMGMGPITNQNLIL